MRGVMVFGALVAGSAWPVGADARPNYPSQVPTPYGCETCHLDPNDRLDRNGFGIDFALERGLWVNPAQQGRGMCFLDSDWDGLTNGQELGDPGCLWRPGSRLPNGPTTHPGDGRDPDQCGDGVIIPLAEDCDRALPDDASCRSMGFDEGELGCAPDCTFDTSDCRVVPPDMAPPPGDAGLPDAGPVADRGVEDDDAAPDGGPTDAMNDDSDAIVDAMHAMSDAMGAMSDAMVDGMDAMVDETDARVETPNGGMQGGSEDGGCRASVGRSDWAGGALFGLLMGLIAVRRRG